MCTPLVLMEYAKNPLLVGHVFKRGNTGDAYTAWKTEVNLGG
jgi:hypothetical protein